MQMFSGSDEDGNWRHIAASVIGSSHVRSSLPCQDAHACEVLRSAADGRPVLVAVVADGAGSASKSQEGAALACSTAIEHAGLILERVDGVCAISRTDAEELVSVVRARIESHATASGLEVREFACTFLLSVIGVDGAFYVQVGDGAIVVSRRDDRGGFGWVFWPHSGEYVNTTSFVTDRDAVTFMQAETARGVVDEVALFTDGIQSLVLNYAARAIHEPFFERVFKPLRAVLEPGPVPSLTAELERYLSRKEIDARTDDDRTLVLASRRQPLGSDS